MSFKELPNDKIWKYAKLEMERRYLLKTPPIFQKNCLVKNIKDKYLLETSLRVRKIYDSETSSFKLTKKLPIISSQKGRQWTSTVYLSKTEYCIFITLPGNIIKKKRHYLEGPTGEIIGVDKIVISKNTIWLAEVEFDQEDKMKKYVFPFNYDKEVTNEEEFAGNELAKRNIEL